MIILGASGHAKEIVDILEESNHQNLFFFDDTVNAQDIFMCKYEIIKTKNDLIRISKNDMECIIGTGNPSVRKLLYEKTKDLNLKFINVISESAIISENEVYFGWGLNIMQQAFISSSVNIGNGTLINRAAGIHHDVHIGDFCEIGPCANILGGVKIGDNVLIGACATILPNIEICSNASIGAGAVVTRDITKPSIYLGIPAKIKIS
jgi:sugar O-acyltransferase (sialic acid O-acetyltransferase NeuD family)